MVEKKTDIVEQVREEARKEVRQKKEKVEKEVGPEETPVQVPQQIPFFNATNLKFIDISHEQFRQYLFANGAKVEIKYPLKLGISRDNVHRVFDVTGLSYFIPPNWITLVTKPRPGGPDIIM